MCSAHARTRQSRLARLQSLRSLTLGPPPPPLYIHGDRACKKCERTSDVARAQEQVEQLHATEVVLDVCVCGGGGGEHCVADHAPAPAPAHSKSANPARTAHMYTNTHVHSICICTLQTLAHRSQHTQHMQMRKPGMCARGWGGVWVRLRYACTDPNPCVKLDCGGAICSACVCLAGA